MFLNGQKKHFLLSFFNGLKYTFPSSHIPKFRYVKNKAFNFKSKKHIPNFIVFYTIFGFSKPLFVVSPSVELTSGFHLSTLLFLQAIQERHENALLKSEMDKLREENKAMREIAKNKAGCPNCGATDVGSGDHTALTTTEQLRIKNAKLKAEVCSLNYLKNLSG